MSDRCERHERVLAKAQEIIAGMPFDADPEIESVRLVGLEDANLLRAEWDSWREVLRVAAYKTAERQVV